MDRQIVVFRLANEEYGIDIGVIQEIVRMSLITPIPQSPDYVKGVINLRGHIVPVIDLCQRFDLPCTEYDKHTRIIVIGIAGNRIGLIVNSVSEVSMLSREAIQPPPKETFNLKSLYIEGIGRINERMVILLDACKLLPQDVLSYAEN